MRNTLFVLFLLCLKISFTQDLSGNLEFYLNNYVEDLPGSSGDDFQLPTAAELNSWNNMLNEIFSSDIESARNFAASFNYQITYFTDTTLPSHNHFYIIEEQDSKTKYWGTYVLSKNALRNKLIIQAPHPVYDINTGLQAIYCFKRLLPSALFISGTHRCNSSEFSDCSGTTSACGSSGPYRISDNAHNTNTVFQETTEFLFNQIPNSVFIQLHGFGKHSDDPDVIMSNGTRITPSIDYVSLVKDGLYSADPSLTFKLANIDLNWSRLIAFTNTQGRFINGSNDPCQENANSSEGRFVHIEQERSKLRSDANAWHKMYSALKETFSIDTTITGIKDHQLKNELHLYPNPNKGRFQIDLKRNSQVSIFNNSGSLVFNYLSNKAENVTIDLSNKPPGIYFLKLITQKEFFYSKIVIMK